MKSSEPAPLRALCEEGIDLLLIQDALGEAAPGQKARLQTLLAQDPALAAQQADFLTLASSLAMNTTVIPPLPASLGMTPPLPPSKHLPGRSEYRVQLVSLAAAAMVITGGICWWLETMRHASPMHVTVASPAVPPPKAPEYFPSGGGPVSAPAQVREDEKRPKEPGATSDAFTGGRKYAVIAAAECVTQDGRPPDSRFAKIRAADAAKFRSLLIDGYGFRPGDIVTLVNAEATSEAIVSAINRHLIAKVQPGDVAVFMFTGHGTLVEDFDGDEEDGVDEAICPWDHDWKKVESWLTDDIIGNMVNRLAHANVLVVTDACHSGTMTRGMDPSEESSFLPMGLDSGFRPRPRSAPPAAPTPPAPPVPPPAPPPSRPVFPPVPGVDPSPPTPQQRREQREKDGFLNLPQTEFEKTFPRPHAAPPQSRVPGAPNLRKEWTEQDSQLIEQVGDLIRRRANQLPDSDKLDGALQKLLRDREGIQKPVMQTEDIETIRAAREFMKLKNTFLPQEVEMLNKALTLAQAAAAPTSPPRVKGSQVSLAATAADRLGWFSTAEGSHFVAAVVPALKAAGATDTSFADLIASITPSIQAKAKEAAQNWRSDKKKPADAPEYQQLPQAEGAVSVPVRAFLAGFQAVPLPPDAPPPPPPAPVQLGWQRQSGDIALHLTTDKTIYMEGDLMTVTLTPDLDCHLRLYYLSADHQVHQIFPNQFQTDGFVKKGQTIALPGAAAAFEFRMGAPFGNEILMAVASSLPFTDQAGEDLKKQLFQEFKDTNLEALAHRGISVQEKKALTGRALHLYRVEAKK